MVNSEKWYKIDRNNVRFLPVTATYGSVRAIPTYRVYRLYDYYIMH